MSQLHTRPPWLSALPDFSQYTPTSQAAVFAFLFSFHPSLFIHVFEAMRFPPHQSQLVPLPPPFHLVYLQMPASLFFPSFFYMRPLELLSFFSFFHQ